MITDVTKSQLTALIIHWKWCECF